jgi:DNA-binding transcriptional LysR family regulator
VRPFDASFESGFAYWLAVPKGAVVGPKIAAFRDWLLAQAEHANTAARPAKIPA